MKFRTYLGRLKRYLLGHKIISLVILLVVVGVAYQIYGYYTNNSSDPRYVVSAVEKGSIISTVTGSGQVSAYRQVELKPKASGDIVYLGAKTGDYVGAGQLLLQVDSRDAKISLENAKLALEKISNPSTNGTNEGLAKDYEDGLASINNLFINLPTVIDGLDRILNNYSASVYKRNLPNDTATSYYNQAVTSFYRAKKAYDKTLTDFQGLNHPVSNESVASLLEEGYQAVLLLDQAMKDSYTYTNYLYTRETDSSKLSASLITDRNNINTWTTTVDNSLADLGSNRNNLRNIPLNIKSQELAVQQQENSYANYFLYAPFSGLVQIDITPNTSVSSGSVIGTIISNKKIATVSLNEVDITKVKVGQKASLSFDAIDGLAIEGEVTEVDVVGTVSQGVVSYNVKIAFDTNDQRIRSGMSASADIVVDEKKNILVVPSSAVKTSGKSSYVETLGSDQAITGRRGVVTTQTPSRIVVTTGLSDDTNVEILSGLKEGDRIITQTLTNSTAAKSATSITSLFRPNNNQKTNSQNSNSSSSGSRSTASVRSSSGGQDFHPPF